VVPVTPERVEYRRKSRLRFKSDVRHRVGDAGDRVDLGKGKHELTTTVTDEADEIIVNGEAVVLVQKLPEAEKRQVGTLPQ